jgi:hypothetical protein
MTAQPITRPTAGAADSVPGTSRNPATVHSVAGATRPAAGLRGRARLAALGLALAADWAPATARTTSTGPPATTATTSSSTRALIIDSVI